MKAKDIARLCLQNLKRRKSRTFLTVLGVIIGCCSIIIMVSIGVGMKESQDAMLAEMGDLTVITVMPPDSQQSGTKPLTDKTTLKNMENIPHVIAVTPRLSPSYDLTVELTAGAGNRYVMDWVTIVGMELPAIEKLDYKLLEGDYPKSGSEILVGENFAYDFLDTMLPEGRNMIYPDAIWDEYTDYDHPPEPPDPFFNPVGMKLVLKVTKTGGGTFTVPLTVTGRVKTDFNKGDETYGGLIMNLTDLEKIIKDAGIKAVSSEEYRTTESNVIVKVDSITAVAEAEQQIKALGYQTYSMESMREPMEKAARKDQFILGGLGAISLLVAALGIMNTMIMSISERKKEIGIMKSLGCYVKNIRAIFLSEAGAIGFIGGLCGLLISFIFSIVMNLVSAQEPVATFAELIALLTTPGSRTSVIPLWLALFAVFFSILIGLGSGYYPANKAVKIAALEAIKD